MLYKFNSRLARLIALFSVLVLLCTTGAAADPAAPTTNPALAAWKGKSVVICFDLDLNEDGIPTALETRYLAARLEDAGVKVRLDETVTARDALFIIGDIAPAQSLVGDDKSDALAVRRHEQQLERHGRSKELQAEAKAKATRISVRTIMAGEVPALFKIGRPSHEQLRKIAIQQLRNQLELRLPEINIKDVALTDVVDFMADVTGMAVKLDRQPMEKAGITSDAPVTIRIKDFPTFLALELMADQAGGAKVSYITDGEKILLTSRDEANRRLKTEPENWRSLNEALPEAITEGPVDRSLWTAMLKNQMEPLNFKGNTLADCIDFMRDTTGIDIYLNKADLAAVKIKLDAPITLKLNKQPAGEALAALAHAASPDDKLVFYCDRGYLLRLTTKEEAAEAVKADSRSFLLPTKD